jgi:subtilisin-like proprotein convertase family protein
VDSVKTASTALSTGLAALLVAGTAFSAQALSYTNNGGTINDIGFTDFTFDVAGTPPTPFDISLEISVLEHPDLFDLQLYLISPSNNVLTLAENLTGTAMVDTVLSDAGIQPIDTVAQPYTGIFKPSQPSPGGSQPATVLDLARFNITDPNPIGTWTLRIYDLVADNSLGGLGTTTLNINAAATPIPFEFNSNTALLLLGGFWGAQKWWQSRRKNPSELN